jgi:hypothetical protein
VKKYIIMLACLSFSLACDNVKAGVPESSASEKAQAAEIEQLKKRLATLEKTPEHHYELRSEGTRTFRFDPATGESCIQLATKEDWKSAETTRQGCQYQDWVSAPTATAQDINSAECLLVHNKKACAELAKPVH